MSSWLLFLTVAAHARPAPVPTTCPWSGAPPVEEIDPNSVTIGGVKYKVGGKHLLAFANVLNLCNAGQVTSALSAWQRAQNAAATQAGLMAATAMSWAAKIAQADTDKQRAELAASAAAEAAAQAVVMKQLDDAAKVARDAFMLALMSSSTAPT